MKKRVERGLNRLIKKDYYLLANNLSERSITHRLGMYYQDLFPEWDVDCEFNRNLGGPKMIDVDPQLFLNQMADLLQGDLDSIDSRRTAAYLREQHVSLEDIVDLGSQLRDSKRISYDREFDIVYFVLTLRDGGELRKMIYPDIIAHKRGTKQNYIVIEAKKSTNTDRMSRAYDLIKLITLVTHVDYKYKRGFFLDLPAGAAALKHRKFVFRKELLNPKIYSVESL